MWICLSTLFVVSGPFKIISYRLWKEGYKSNGKVERGGKKEENQKNVYRSGQADWEGSLYEKVLTWMIPERTVTVAATITL